jgi:IclR family acetate operon transcriptional repressor
VPSSSPRTMPRPGATDTPVAPLSSDGLAGNKATARVLIVLTRLAEGAETQGVTELSRELGMTKNMVSRALSTLVRHGFAVRDESGVRYQLGPGIARLAIAGLPELDLEALCAPFMRQMRDVTGETVTLAVPWGRNAVTVYGVRGRGVIARRVPLGRVIPLHVSPASRAILAAFPDPAIEQYLERSLERFSSATLTDPAAIWTEVRAVRARGYATVIGDHWRGTNGVAFPLPAGSEYPHGSVTIAGPADRLAPRELERVLPELRSIADELSGQTVLYASEYSVVAR